RRHTRSYGDWSSDVCSSDLWMRRLPHASFTNLYGPTEATIASSYYRVPACPASEDEVIPIGRACDGEELLVLDEALRPVPPGERSEERRVGKEWRVGGEGGG